MPAGIYFSKTDIVIQVHFGVGSLHCLQKALTSFWLSICVRPIWYKTSKKCRPEHPCFMCKRQDSPFRIRPSLPVSEWNMEPYEVTLAVTTVSLLGVRSKSKYTDRTGDQGEQSSKPLVQTGCSNKKQALDQPDNRTDGKNQTSRSPFSCGPL